MIPALFLYIRGKLAIKLANLYMSGLLFLDHRRVLGVQPPIGGKTEKPPLWGRRYPTPRKREGDIYPNVGGSTTPPQQWG